MAVGLRAPRKLAAEARAALRRRALAPARRRGLERLDARGDESARRVAAAVRRTLSRRDDGEARAWERRIEALRQELLECEDTITVRAVEYAPDAEDRELVETVGATCRMGSRPPLWSRFLLALAHETAPRAALELGTCLGVSAAFQAAGMRLAGGGRLVTLDASAERAALARENLRRLGLDDVDVVRARFQEALGPVLEQLAPVDYAFVDGHHDEQATREYFETIARHASPGAMVVVDDISWSDGMASAWRAVSGDRRTGLAVDLGEVGVCAIGGGEPELVRLPLR